MKLFHPLAAASVVALGTSADASVLLAYAQNFDSLGTSSRSITGSGAIGAQGVISGLDGNWFGARIGGTSTTPLSATVGDGATSGGGIYNFGVTGSLDRSLGTVASGTTVAGFGIVLVNTSGSEATSITITFDARQFRSSTVVQNVLAFAYGFSGGGATSADFLSSTQMIALSAGDVVGASPVATNGVISPPTSATISFTIANVAWANGQSLFLRWQDANEAGNDAGLGIDNFSLVAVPAPGALAFLGLACMASSRRRR